MKIRVSKTKYYIVANSFENYAEFKDIGHEALRGDVKPMSIEDGALGEARMRDMPDMTEVLLDTLYIYRQKLDLCAKIIYRIL